MRRLEGKNALVTGAMGGIGTAIARRLAAEGAAVALLDVADPAPLAEELTARGDRALSVVGDVSDEADWTAAVSAVRDRLGPVDILVSTAYAVRVAPAHETSRQSWDHQLGVSLTGSFLGVRACLDDLRARSGAVVLISSVHALVGLPGRPAYAAAKGGLVALGRQLAVEYGPQVRVNTVLPGPSSPPPGQTCPKRTAGAASRRPSRSASAHRTRWPPRSPSSPRRTPPTSPARASWWTVAGQR